MRLRDIYFNDIPLDEISYENISIYEISCKTFMGAKPLPIRFNKTDGFIKLCNGIRNLEIFGYRLHDEIYNRIRYVSEK